VAVWQLNILYAAAGALLCGIAKIVRQLQDIATSLKQTNERGMIKDLPKPKSLHND
jgi:hypothetical protein